MTITSERQKIIDFTDPYYYTPAQMTASTASGITTLEGMAEDCVRRRGDDLPRLARGQAARLRDAVADHHAAGRHQGHHAEDRRPSARSCGAPVSDDFEGFLSSSTTVEGAIEAGLPMIKVGDPVYAAAARGRRLTRAARSRRTSSRP